MRLEIVQLNIGNRKTPFMLICFTPHPSCLPHRGNAINLGVGNAVPGVPSGAMRKHRARNVYRTAAFGGRNAGDGVPYGCLSL